MRVDVIELLRCPAAHDASPLVTVARVRDGDWLIDATLGCPLCGAEYALRNGIVFLGDNAHASSVEPTECVDAMRVAALLGVGDPDARVLLCGTLGVAAVAIEAASGARCIVLNAQRGEIDKARVDELVVNDAIGIPLASASLNGLAVDDTTLAVLHDAARVVRRGGRIMAPVHAPVPNGCRELARDDREWVAESEGLVSEQVGVQLRRP